MYQPTTRVLAVLELLQSRRRLSGPELADRLEVDLRTVRRYVTMLQDIGIPVEGERGRHGGYVLRAGYKLPPLMLSDDEALAVALGLLAARRLGLAATAPAVEGALAKLERVLPPALRERVTAVQQTLVTDLPPPGEAPPGAALGAIGEAAHQRRRVWLRYADARGDLTERDFDPYGVAYVAGRWYAAGYCHLREALRSFRLDRMREIVPREVTFDRPPDFDALAYIQESLASAPDIWSFEVVLQTTVDEARRRVPPTAATLTPIPEGVLMRGQIEELEGVARLLAALGCPFVVRAPDELRDALRSVGETLIAAASQRAGQEAA